MALSDRGPLGLYESDQQVRPTGSCHAGGVGGGSLCAVFFLLSDFLVVCRHTMYPSHGLLQDPRGCPPRTQQAHAARPVRVGSCRSTASHSAYTAWHGIDAMRLLRRLLPRRFACSRIPGAQCGPQHSPSRCKRTEGPMQTERQQRRASPTQSTQARHIGGLGRPRSSTHASARPQPAANRIEWQLRPKRDPPAARALAAAAARAAAAGRPR